MFFIFHSLVTCAVVNPNYYNQFGILKKRVKNAKIQFYGQFRDQAELFSSATL